ncbi:MAG: DNA polymerase Y family protein [Chloroflexi bacterium]|nr:DNA polymerase Y family protein [Chloroflexota bacterium]
MRFSSLRTLVAAPPAWADVRVACVWLPQLPLRVEVLRRPALDGRPLVLGGGPGERKVVRLCSPEAERAGIVPGLPLREVVALARDAVVLQPDPVRTASALEEVLAGLQRISPAVEAADEALFLDLRGLAGLYEQDLRALERAIRAMVPPLLRPRIGLAAGKFAAEVAARTAGPGERSIVVPERETARFLAPLSIAHLPFGPDDLQRLTYLGLRTVGDLARLPFGAVQAQFGPTGARAWKLASGRDDEPITPRRYGTSVRVSLRVDDPLASVQAIEAALEHLLIAAFADPALHGRAVHQARLRALLADDTSWERLSTFKVPVADRAAALLGLKARLDLPNGLPPAPVDELFLELLGLQGDAAQQGMLFTARASQMPAIKQAGRLLRARYGGRLPLYHAREVEPWSRIPERRWALVTCDL